jgi:molybdopterin/thiamine biosynthesis adenylyltransferase
MKAPIKQRQAMIGVVFAAVILGHIVLPLEHPVRVNTGGSWHIWALLAGFGVIILIYRTGLRQLRGRVRKTVTNNDKHMSETELDRYARHIVMPEIGGSGQMRLRRAKVLVIGAGGLGAPAMQYLAAAGVGTIGVIDEDVVEASNLQRQIIHRDADIGLAKVESAAQSIRALNPYVAVKTYRRKFQVDIAEALISEYDIVLDGTDNFDTRYMVNRACVIQKVPLVSGALTQWEGQLSVFDPDQSGPCYQCVFPEAPKAEISGTCAQVGVFAALPGVIGSLMAGEALKYLLDAGKPLRGKLAIYNILDAETRVISTKVLADCPICQS